MLGFYVKEGVRSDKIDPAYCAFPSNITDLALKAERNCEQFNGLTELTDQVRPAMYDVIQKEANFYFTGSRCSAQILHRRVYYCGADSHTVDVPMFEEMLEPIEITKDECTKMLFNKQFTYQGITRKIYMGQETRLKFISQGKVYIYSSNNKPYCEGVSEGLKLTGVDGSEQTLNYGVSAYLLSVTIEEKIKLRTDMEGNTFDLTHKRDLPGCGHTALGCMLSDATYTWDPPELCNYANIQRINGIQFPAFDLYGRNLTIVTTAKNKDPDLNQVGQTNIMRFEKRDEIGVCDDRRLFRTNYPGFFLQDSGISRPILKKIHPTEIRTEFYAANRDDYLYHDLRDTLEIKFNGILAGLCYDINELDKVKQYMQRKEPGLHSFLLGRGRFGTNSGEAFYTYNCIKVYVEARTTNTCYADLPVTKVDPLTNHSHALFLQPYSRKLVPYSAELPCVPEFLPKYEAASGAWLYAAPEILSAAPPKSQDISLTSDLSNISIPNRDFTKPGLYTTEDLQRMREYLDLSQKREVLSIKLVRQLQGNAFASGTVGPGNLFPSFSLWDWMKDTFWNFLATWGSAASIFMGAYTLFALFKGLISTFYNALMLKDNYGCSKMLGWSCCMQQYLARKVNRYQQNEKTYQLDIEANNNSPPPDYDDNPPKGILKRALSTSYHNLSEQVQEEKERSRLIQVFANWSKKKSKSVSDLKDTELKTFKRYIDPEDPKESPSGESPRNSVTFQFDAQGNVIQTANHGLPSAPSISEQEIYYPKGKQ